MVFNSFSFIVFFIVVFLIYHLALHQHTKVQNIFLLIASYFFYGYADWRMLPILIGATVLYYLLGIGIEKSNDKRATLLKTIGVILGLSLLGYFKYFNFFIDSFVSLLNHFGLQVHWHTMQIIMPLGISFFTFRLLSYILEIDRRHIVASRNVIPFALYVAFFPCLLAGPIDRPNTFLPQLEKKRAFNYDLSVDGIRQVLWGLFKKVVIADNLSIYVDTVWNNTVDLVPQSASTLLLAMVLYLFQLYADFSGYSDMAIGIAKLLGIRLADNFRAPLFALNIVDYWKRWHISLTTWLTDYVFMPLNIKFRNLDKWGIIFAILITFMLIGFWHGADWTFGLFGLYHGLLYIPLILSGVFYKKTKLKTNQYGLPVFRDFCRIVLTNILVMLGLLLFRAPSLTDCWHFIASLCDSSILSLPLVENVPHLLVVCAAICVMLLMEWKNRLPNRWWMYYVLTLAIWWFAGQDIDFIYFQF